MLITVIPLVLVHLLTNQISDFFEINETVIFRKLIIIWIFVSIVWSIFSPFLLSLNYKMKYLFILKLEIVGVLINLLVTIIGLNFGALLCTGVRSVFPIYIFFNIYLLSKK